MLEEDKDFKEEFTRLFSNSNIPEADKIGDEFYNELTLP